MIHLLKNDGNTFCEPLVNNLFASSKDLTKLKATQESLEVFKSNLAQLPQRGLTKDVLKLVNNKKTKVVKIKGKYFK